MVLGHRIGGTNPRQHLRERGFAEVAVAIIGQSVVRVIVDMLDPESRRDRKLAQDQPFLEEQSIGIGRAKIALSQTGRGARRVVEATEAGSDARGEISELHPVGLFIHVARAEISFGTPKLSAATSFEPCKLVGRPSSYKACFSLASSARAFQRGYLSRFYRA